ncbi:MAG: flagellar basal body-associated FliL family protein [Miltoncostaeaceae bacterium]
MKKILMIALPLVVLVLGGAGWMLFMGGSGPDTDPTKTPGPVASLNEQFIVNLADDPAAPRFVKMGVAVRLAESSAALYTPAKGATPGALQDEPQVRDIIISTVQSRTAAALNSERGRTAMKRELIRRINKETELRILDVYYTDFAVQ